MGAKWGETNFSNVGGDKCSVMTSYVLSWADNNGLKVWQKIVRYIRMAQCRRRRGSVVDVGLHGVAYMALLLNGIIVFFCNKFLWLHF